MRKNRGYSRREMLQWLGVSIGLPLLESAFPLRWALAAENPKKRFIGCFFPSGAPMPGGANGEWTFDGVLKPLADAGLRSQIVIPRGFRACERGDVHWSGTAAFLSCNEIGYVTDPAGTRLSGERCGKSFDQYVADLEATRVRSLHVGWNTVSGWDDSHDQLMSINYVNAIAWRSERSLIHNTMDARAMFAQVFGDGTSVADHQIQFLLKRRKSVLDGVLPDLSHFRSSISAGDRAKMDAYEESIREVERELSANLVAAPGGCSSAGVLAGNGSAYQANFRLMQKIVVRAFQCGVTRAATIMYHEGIGNNSIESGTGHQHDAAHNDWEVLKRLNLLQVGLWAELIADLKAAGVLDETIVLLGSNMSDGRTHHPANIPLAIATGGSGLKLGQEISATDTVADASLNRPMADLYVDLFKLYGIGVTSFGEGNEKSSGTPSGILA